MPVVPELPTLSAKTVMNTRSSMLSKYIDAKQNRRRKAKYHQKRLKMGLPAAVPLKPVSLDQQEKEAIASTEAIGTARQKRLFVTKHFAWPVSLGVHIFAGFLITVYAITEYIPEEEPVSLDFVEPVREARQISRRSPIRPTKPPDTLIQAPRVRQTPTAIEIPREEAQLHTLGGDLTPVEDAPNVGSIDIPKGLDVQVEQKRVEIIEDTPKVKIERDTSFAPEDNELGDIPDAGLDDRAIDVQVEVQVDQKPSVLRRVKPEYPDAAKRANREAVVFVEFTVDVNGKAIDIKIADPKGFGFDEAAIEAIKKWRFTPAKKGGESVPMRVRQPIRFNLDD